MESPVQFRTTTFAAILTRAATLTGYAANQVIQGTGNVGMVFGQPLSAETPQDGEQTSPLRIGSLYKSGEINRFQFEFGVSAPTDFTVWLFTAPLTIADYATFAITADQWSKYFIGRIPLTTEDFVQIATSPVMYSAVKNNIDWPFDFEQNDANVTGQIFAYLVANEAMTPTNAQIHRAKLTYTSD